MQLIMSETLQGNRDTPSALPNWLPSESHYKQPHEFCLMYWELSSPFDILPPAHPSNTYLETHPRHCILLWTEDSLLPFAPAVHVSLLLCHHDTVISHVRVPVKFWHLDLRGILIIWLHGERLHFLLQRLLLLHEGGLQ